jgi:NAD(P)-dependent dehydrogenase (short-subunit alcohol dehydrogenase family)
MQEIAGRTVLVTGGAQGIGLGIAHVFAGAGARIALVDVDAAKLAEAARGLGAVTEVVTHVLDVRDRDGFARVADAVEAELGPIAVLCNNAGVAGLDTAASLTYEQWDRVLGINLGGVVNGVQTVLPRLLARGGPGHIVNVASGAGLVAAAGVLYATSKFAVVGLSESLLQEPELQQRRIGVTVVCPSFVRTRIVENSVRTAGLDRTSDPRLEGADVALQQYGLPPEVVGQQVLEAVRQERPYVLTDRMMAGPIEERTRAILASLPPETERDREITKVLQEQFAARGQQAAAE